MFLAFVLLLALIGGAGFLAWLGWKRVAANARKNPEAIEALTKHLFLPLLQKEEPKKPEVTRG
ncbi:MAG TPA: hypothetical protein VH092_24920, partial [Urbifossiella sp.]|nr:hypothetical protein [Urbifossiella sp.]